MTDSIRATLESLNTAQDKTILAEPPEFQAPARVRLPVPAHLKFFAVPTDLNAFINDLYPNLKTFALAKLQYNADLVDTTLSEFTKYMMEEDRDGLQRWLRYDPVKYSKQPYFKWFITNLKFYCQTYRKNDIRDKVFAARHFGFVESDDADAGFTPGVVSLERFGHVNSIDPTTAIAYSQITDYLEALQRQHAGVRCFEAHALTLFRMRYDGENNTEIARSVGISPSAIRLWMNRLTALLAPKFGENSTLPNLEVLTSS